MDDSQEHVISLALIFWEAATATVNIHAYVQWEMSSAGIARLLLLWALECQVQSVLYSILCRAVCCFLQQPCNSMRHVFTIALVPCLCPMPSKEE